MKEYFGYKSVPSRRTGIKPAPKSVRLSLLNGESGEVEVFSTRNWQAESSLENTG